MLGETTDRMLRAGPVAPLGWCLVCGVRVLRKRHRPFCSFECALASEEFHRREREAEDEIENRRLDALYRVRCRVERDRAVIRATPRAVRDF